MNLPPGKKNSPATRIYTTDDLVRRTGLTLSAILHRIRTRESICGPIMRVGHVYVLTHDQYEIMSENWGKGQIARRMHAAKGTSPKKKKKPCLP